MRRTISALVVGLFASLFTLAAPTPASATQYFDITLDCVTNNGDGTYSAVFGYYNNYDSFEIPHGVDTSGSTQYRNTITPSKYDKVQPQRFEKGTYAASFSVKFAASETVQWRIHYKYNNTTYLDTSVSATKSSKVCSTGPALPGAGNGTGPLIVLGVSMLIAFVVYLVRRRTNVA